MSPAGRHDAAGLDEERRTLLLLRHAKSSWEDGAARDQDRQLAPRGERAAAAMGAYLCQSGLAPGLVLCSPSARTRGTLTIVLRQLGPAREVASVQYEEDLYLADGATLLAAARQWGRSHRCVMVVAHQPGLADATLELDGTGSSSDRARIAAKFPTGALAQLSFVGPWSSLAPGAARLEGFVTPKELV
jgi:phosphohistidine phosphatase